jgi:glycosyltransferase involved in cell wall biosynthesis
VKVLLCVHHRLDPDAGAPGATLELGRTLAAVGCEVDYFAYDHAFGEISREGVRPKVSFPWKVATFLTRHASSFDVIDASTGDAWLWASLGRPRARRPNALVTRSHGLEHTAHEAARESARSVGPGLSWKYPLYHGGFRLWEVKRSLELADHCILLNAADRDYVRDRLRVPPERLSVVPNGISDRFHEAPAPAASAGPLRLAFIGRWTTYKGKHTLVEAAVKLDRRGVDFTLSALGTGAADAVAGDFPEHLRNRVCVIPTFANAVLPELLAGHEILIFPTLSEGSSGSLLEAMACGLVPVATSVGSAPELLAGKQSGTLVPVNDAEAIATAVERLASDREALLELRRRAQQTGRRFRWRDVVARTLDVYRRALAARSTTSRKRGPTLNQV